MSEYKLILGDCLDFMRTMPDKSVDAVITDPPYGIGIADWDIRPDNWLIEVERISNGAIYWFGMPADMNQEGYRTLIYAKTIPLPRSAMNRQPDYTYSYQPIFYKKGKWTKDRHETDVLLFHPEVGIEQWYHHTQKPIRLIRQLLSLSTNEGDTIFDPFMGSGTTGVACMQLGRNFIGCEIDPGYYAIAEKRIKQAAAQMLLPL